MSAVKIFAEKGGSSLGNFKITLLIVYAVIGMLGWYSYHVERGGHAGIVYKDLSPALTSSYVRSLVWYHSRGKLQELRLILETGNLEETEKIKQQITNMLKHRTQVYINSLNLISAPIENLGTWYAGIFKFEPFLEDVFSAAFNPRLTVDEKIVDVTNIMEAYQNAASQELDHHLNLTTTIE